MKGKKYFARLVAVICMVAMIGCYMELPIKATSSDIPEPSGYTTVLGIKDFTGQDTYPIEQGQIPLLAAGEGTLDGVMIDGIYNIPRYAAIQIGSKDQYRLHIGVNNAEYLLIQFVTPSGAYGAKTFAPGDIGCAYNGKDIRIRTGFTFTNKDTTAGTADVLMQIWIEDSFYYEIKAEGMPMAKFPRHMLVNALNGAVNLKAVPTDSEEPGGTEDVTGEYATVLGMKDFTGKDTYPVAQGQIPLLNAGTGTLDDVLIDGIYNIPRYAAIQIGSKDQYRLHIGVNNAEFLLIQFVTPNGAYGAKTFAPGDVGCAYNGKDIRIKTGFTFSNKDEAAGTADVLIKIWIEDSFYYEITAEGMPMAKLTKDILVNALNAPVTLTAVPSEEGDGEEEEIPTEINYTSTLGMKDFTGKEEVTYTSEIKPSAGDKSLDGVLIDGIFNFTGNAVIYIGAANWTGLRFELTGTDSIRYRYLPGDLGDTIVTPDQADCDLWGSDVRIKVGYTFVSKDASATNTDAIVQVFIGEKYENTFTLKNVAKSSMIGRMFVYPQTGSLTLKEAPKEEEPGDVIDPNITYASTLGLKDFTQRDEVTYTTEIKPSAGDKSLNGVLIDGYYNFTGNACMYIGAADWTGLRLELAETDSIRYRFLGTADAHDTIVSPEDAGCELNGKDVRIKIGYTFVEGTETDTTTDVIIQVFIGEIYLDTFKLTGVRKSSMVGRMFVYPQTGSITLKDIPRESNDPKVPEGFIAKYDKVMKFTDFGITADTTVANSEIKPNGGDKLSIDKMMVEGVYRLTGPQAAFYIGSRGWGGFRIGSTIDGLLTYQFFDNNGQGGMHVMTVTKDDIGSELLDTDIRIKVGFTIIKEDKAAGTADVVIDARIGSKYQELFVVKGVQKSNLIRGMHVYAGETSSVTLKVDASDLQYVDEPDDKKLSYKEELTFFDFGITKDFVVEELQTRKVIPGTLDGVSIEGTFLLSGNSILGFGGDWRGLQFQRTKTGMLYQYLDTDGKGGIYSRSITTEDTGCALYDEDLTIKVGFNFSNVNAKKGTADVTIEVNIGPNYRDVFTVKGVLTANLNRHILMYAADAESGLTGSKMILRKPYMEPFDFGEFGFTKKWKKELRLD